MLHRPRRARNADPFGGEPLADAVNIGNAKRDMAKAGAEVIGLFLIPVVRQLNDRVVLLISIADEREGEFPARVILLAQHFHPEPVTVEREGFVQIPDPDHRMQHLEIAALCSHGFSTSFRISRTMPAARSAGGGPPSPKSSMACVQAAICAARNSGSRNKRA